MINKELFGRKISLLRKKRGLSQVELAEKLNISPQAVSKWECGQALPDIDLLVELSWIYDISINTMLEENVELFNKRMDEKAVLSKKIKALLNNTTDKKLLSSIAPYFTELEKIELASQLASGDLLVSLSIKTQNEKINYKKSLEIPLNMLSCQTLNEISSVTSETLYDSLGISNRCIKRICDILICPECKEKLKLSDDGKTIGCKNGHSYKIDDGVIYFNTREIKGELWSLNLRNYKDYLQQVTTPLSSVYTRGEVFSEEIKWREIEKRRPRIILDVASGEMTGIRYILKRINWNCTIILTDLSYRILAWNRKFFTENINNPYVDMVYLACDCSNIPLSNNSVDCITSTAGFESMQKKMMRGFSECYRILKSKGNAIYDISLIQNYNDPNVIKWMELFQPIIDQHPVDFRIMDLSEWKEVCLKTGYKLTESFKVYGELPAPSTDIFPFKNNIIQWMSTYICVSKKR